MNQAEIKETVRERYGKVAKESTGCCGPVSSCCGSGNPAETISKAIGYTDSDLEAVPEGANLGLGCGNPVALASLKPGDTVVDLGSGAGFDCFLAANNVGDAGRVIGVDMTPEMLDKARTNAEKGGYGNVEFRQGEIETIPVEDNSVDAIISNCVINLSPDKNKVFSEAYRILKPGGRLMVSDIVLLDQLPEEIQNSIEAYVGCIAGALLKDDYLAAIGQAGFDDVEVVDETTFPVEYLVNDPNIATALAKAEGIPDSLIARAAASVASIKVRAVKSS